MIDINDAITAKRKNKDETWRFFAEMGNIDGNTLLARSYEGIKNAWAGKPCFIIGSGPDLKEFINVMGFDFLNGRHTIGINHVIEDYDKFEWFIFLDKRFLDKTTYDLNKFKGRIFASCLTGLKPDYRTTIYHTTVAKPTTDVKDGLYNGNLSGLVALNLALISGANPIYLLGFGMGKESSAESYHYKYEYTAEDKSQKRYTKFQNVQNYFKAFLPWKDRIIHVTEGKDLVYVPKKMSFTSFKNMFSNKNVQIIANKATPKIVHISFSSDINKHADITRYVVKECFGEHKLIAIDDEIPNADLYITEHFQSTDKFLSSFPYREKTINIVHTTGCVPKERFAVNIALTNAWAQILRKYYIDNVKVIYGGIDTSAYKDINIDYSSKVFGRITRWSLAKVHPHWNTLVNEILNEIPESKCLIFSQLDQVNKRPILQHERMIYDKSCQINMFKGDFLKRLAIYVHANGSFKETLSFGVIEAMASGLPIIYLKEGTGVLEEVTGGQICCDDIETVKRSIIALIKKPERAREFGEKARKQSYLFDKNIMVAKFNEVINECLQ